MSTTAPQETILRMLQGTAVAQAIHVAAKLKIADLLTGGARTVDDLAAATQTDPRSLYRLLRALASLGVFAEGDPRTFALTPLAECLRSDVPGSQYAMAVMLGEELFGAWSDLIGSIRTGRPSYETIVGKPIFEYLAEHPEKAKLFDAAMTSVHGRETAAMADAFDFSAFGTLADIGGGNASTLIGLLGRTPSLQGLLFDLPSVMERARSAIAAAGLSERCRVAGGSFFEAIPEGADAYMLRHIIHDWNDAKSLTILRNVRKVMSPNARLLVVETVIPTSNAPCGAKFLDLVMLIALGGMERTEAEYRDLYTQAGFRLSRIVPTTADVSVIEGVPV
jgi:hypothetical protein